MSLLMDALKKAEQEKKEAQRQHKTGPNPIADTGQHPIKPKSLENTDAHELTISQEMDLSLEPMSSESVDLEQDFTDEMPVSLENTSEMTIEQPTPEADVDTDEYSIENTQELSAELPSIMERGNGLSYDGDYEEEFEESHESAFGDYEYEETLDSVTATQLVQDIGGGADQPTPVAAHTVFEAGASSQWASGSRWMMIGVSVVLILVAGGVLIHYQTTPTVRDIPKPMALPDEIRAQQAAIAALPKPQLPPEPQLEVPVPASGELISPAEESVTVAEAEAVTTVSDDATAIDTAQPDAKSSVATAADASQDQGETPASSTAEPATPSIEPDQYVALAEPETFPEIGARVEPFQPLVPATPVTPELIKISRSQKPRQSSADIRQAFQAYQNGDISRAEQLYRAGLANSPDNRDGLLGLAAIHLKQGNKAAAFLIYKKLLQLNPKDNVARLALLRLQGRVDPVRNESVLKSLLAERPDSPQLYFSLGSLYASQQKWADAQQAFFEAFSLDNQNPDYALNLAISLDRMGQEKAARNFYQRAVELADEHPASFSTNDVLVRLQALSQSS